MSGLFEIDLRDGERVILRVRQHWLLLLWPIWRTLILASLGGYGIYYFRDKLDPVLITLISLIWILLVINFSLLHHFLKWYLKLYVLTNRRVINVTHQGIFKRQVTEAYLHKVQDVTHRSTGMMSLMFGYGDIIVQTAGHQTLIHFRMVPNSRHIHKQINNLIADHSVISSDTNEITV